MAKNFNDPSNSLANKNKSLTLRFWSLTWMTKPSEEIVFKAFLTDFSDEYTSNWNNENVYGRQDPLSVFQNTQRTINVSLDVPASDVYEGQKNLIKMEKLIQGLYPVYETYKSVPVLSAAPLWRIKLANFITSTDEANDSAKSGGLTCKLGGLNFTPDLEPGVFVHSSGYYFPKNIKLTFSALIFHDHTVGFDTNRRFLSGQEKKMKGFPYGIPFNQGRATPGKDVGKATEKQTPEQSLKDAATAGGKAAAEGGSPPSTLSKVGAKAGAGATKGAAKNAKEKLKAELQKKALEQKFGLKLPANWGQKKKGKKK